MASWLESLMSLAKTWALSGRLRKYGPSFEFPLKWRVYFLPGNISNSYLNSGTEAKTEIKTFPSLIEVEKIKGYRFNNHSLLDQVFTHPSYHQNCVSYERLEYLGDSVLNFLVAKEQFYMYPNLPPGSLTHLRAANVDTEKLARAAIQHNFHQYIRHGLPVHKKQVQAFIDVLPKHPVHSHGLIDAPKVLADVVESTIGAVFIDSNCSIDTTWKIASYLLKPMITPESLQTNAVQNLLQICQKNKLQVRFVDMWSQDGTYEVFVNDKLKGKGICHEKKKIALNIAANDAYEEVRKMSMTRSSDAGY